MATTYEDHWPGLTRFYGISPSELATLPRNITRLYVEKQAELEAGEQLDRMQAAAYPHMDEKDQGKVHREHVQKLPYVEPESEAIDPRTDAGRLALAGLGIGVRRAGE